MRHATQVVDLGAELVGTGGLATSTTALSGGYLTVSGGGSSVQSYLFSGAAEYVFSASAASVTEAAGATVIIANGGVAAFNSGGLNGYVASAGVVELADDGASYVSSAATITGITVGTEVSLVALNAGQTTSITVSGYNAYEVVYSGGAANFTTVQTSGYLDLSGGVASDTIVQSGGTLTVAGGGIASASTIASGGYAVISTGGLEQGGQAGAGLDDVVEVRESGLHGRMRPALGLDVVEGETDFGDRSKRCSLQFHQQHDGALEV